MEYRVPFREGVVYREAKPTGQFAHENFPEARYAIDFVVDLDTEVLAAAEGKVFSVQRGSTTHFRPQDLIGMDIEEIKKLANKHTNYVCIEHPDGTFTEYLHLGPDVPVSEGQDVESGKPLGYTGQSGVMSESHLHFNAFKLTEGGIRSIPVNLCEK
ncbi:MAG: M23 family metallopeptidase [Candidatus Aenigmarchaeota archaeon]|nr:M23 family metallopeptidase [Candidatus Aenigmarchaeota archaeon]